MNLEEDLEKRMAFSHPEKHCYKGVTSVWPSSYQGPFGPRCRGAVDDHALACEEFQESGGVSVGRALPRREAPQGGRRNGLRVLLTPRRFIGGVSPAGYRPRYLKSSAALNLEWIKEKTAILHRARKRDSYRKNRMQTGHRSAD